MRRRLLGLAVAAAVVTGGAGVAVAQSPVSLTAHGAATVSGTEATAVFEVGERTVRQVRYRDRGVLEYHFVLRNGGALPVRVDGVRAAAPTPQLFRVLSLRDAGGDDGFEVGAGDDVPVVLRLRMTGCEALSARAGSFVSAVVVRASRAGVLDDDVTVALPEELHTGSAREAFCPRATATSRPPG